MSSSRDKGLTGIAENISLSLSPCFTEYCLPWVEEVQKHLMKTFLLVMSTVKQSSYIALNNVYNLQIPYAFSKWKVLLMAPFNCSNEQI